MDLKDIVIGGAVTVAVATSAYALYCSSERNGSGSSDSSKLNDLDKRVKNTSDLVTNLGTRVTNIEEVSKKNTSDINTLTNAVSEMHLVQQKHDKDLESIRKSVDTISSSVTTVSDSCTATAKKLNDLIGKLNEKKDVSGKTVHGNDAKTVLGNS